MDSKTKHRLLGLLVLAGLVVIILPFLQTGKELPAESAAINAPPFPDQSIQVTAAAPVETAMTASPDTIKLEPDDIIKTEHPSEPQKVAPPIENPIIENKSDAKPEKNPETSPESKLETKSTNTELSLQSDKTTVAANDEQPVEDAAPTKVTLAKKPIKATKKITTSSTVSTKKKAALHANNVGNNGLFKIQDAAWVIQVGSFKSKANALRVVNNLRANGYSAFIQQFSTAMGSNTRVFVGPENKQSSARNLAEDIEERMHMRGIVISYKPLAL